MYKALKKDWLPYNQAFDIYIKKGDKNRFINKVPMEFKEQINRVWFVNIKWFEEYQKGNIEKVYTIKKGD